jgi:hypothetical protein
MQILGDSLNVANRLAGILAIKVFENPENILALGGRTDVTSSEAECFYSPNFPALFSRNRLPSLMYLRTI